MLNESYCPPGKKRVPVNRYHKTCLLLIPFLVLCVFVVQGIDAKAADDNAAYAAPLLQRNVVLEDEFHGWTLDPLKWEERTATGKGTGFGNGSGSAVRLSGDALVISQEKTDSGGAVVTKPITPTAAKILKITKRTFVHYGNRFFSGATAILGGETHEDNLGQIGYYHYYSGKAADRFNAGSINSTAGLSPTWDQWFDEVITYDPASGKLTLSVNGGAPVSIMATPTCSPFRVGMHSYGWYTGHTHKVDRIRIEWAEGKPQAVQPLVVRTVKPSGDAYVVSYQDKVHVTIPGGMLTSEQPLTIAAVSPSASKNPQGVTELAAYAISLGDRRAFEKPITIELAYNPAQIESDLPPEKALFTAWWDEEEQVWQPVPAQVDTVRNLVRIYTRHLSDWKLYAWDAKHTITENDHFRIVYKRNSEIWIGETYAFAEKFKDPKNAEKVGGLLENAYVQYAAKGFKMPFTGFRTRFMYDMTFNPDFSMKSWVFLDLKGFIFESEIGRGVPEWSKYTGIIYLRGIYDREDLLKHDVAHELFHQIQNEYLSIVGMGGIKWWIEATADCAASTSWGDRELILPSRRIVPREYLPVSLLTADGAHEYLTSHFVRYMIKQAPDTLNFKDMWEASTKMTSLQGTEFLLNLSNYIYQVSGKHPSGFYRQFAAHLLFDRDAPVRSPDIKRDGLTDGDRILTKEQSSAEPWKVALSGGYTARVWKIKAEMKEGQSSRRLTVKLVNKTGAGVCADVYRLAQDVRQSGVTTAAELCKAGDSVTVDVTASDGLYVVASNTGVDDGTLEVLVSEAAITSLIIDFPEALSGTVSDNPCEVKARAQNFPQETQKVRLEWDLSEAGVAGIPGEERDVQPLLEFKIPDRQVFRKIGLSRIKATLYDISPNLSIPRKLSEASLEFYIASIGRGKDRAEVEEALNFSALPVGDFTYKWDFGDGETLSAKNANITHRYKSPGKYRIDLKLLNAKGDKLLATDGLLVEVIAKDAGTKTKSSLGTKGWAALLPEIAPIGANQKIFPVPTLGEVKHGYAFQGIDRGKFVWTRTIEQGTCTVRGSKEKQEPYRVWYEAALTPQYASFLSFKTPGPDGVWPAARQGYDTWVRNAAMATKKVDIGDLAIAARVINQPVSHCSAWRGPFNIAARVDLMMSKPCAFPEEKLRALHEGTLEEAVDLTKSVMTQFDEWYGYRVADGPGVKGLYTPFDASRYAPKPEERPSGFKLRTERASLVWQWHEQYSQEKDLNGAVWASNYVLGLTSFQPEAKDPSAEDPLNKAHKFFETMTKTFTEGLAQRPDLWEFKKSGNISLPGADEAVELLWRPKIARIGRHGTGGHIILVRRANVVVACTVDRYITRMTRYEEVSFPLEPVADNVKLMNIVLEKMKKDRF